MHALHWKLEMLISFVLSFFLLGSIDAQAGLRERCDQLLYFIGYKKPVVTPIVGGLTEEALDSHNKLRLHFKISKDVPGPRPRKFDGVGTITIISRNAWLSGSTLKVAAENGTFFQFDTPRGYRKSWIDEVTPRSPHFAQVPLEKIVKIEGVDPHGTLIQKFEPFRDNLFGRFQLKLSRIANPRGLVNAKVIQNSPSQDFVFIVTADGELHRVSREHVLGWNPPTDSRFRDPDYNTMWKLNVFRIDPALQSYEGDGTNPPLWQQRSFPMERGLVHKYDRNGPSNEIANQMLDLFNNPNERAGSIMDAFAVTFKNFPGSLGQNVYFVERNIDGVKVRDKGLYLPSINYLVPFADIIADASYRD